MSGEILIDRGDDVVTITISDPARRNALSLRMYEQLAEECRRVAADRRIRALVLRGAAGHFAGGTDIRELEAITDGERGVAYEHLIRDAQDALLALRIPVISVVEGACVGGGLVFAALSDFVFCTPDARFGSPIAQTLGNTLSPRSLRRIQELVGRRRAAEMLFTARLLDAMEAHEAGLVTAVVEPDGIEARLAEVVGEIRRGSPTSIWSFKELDARGAAADEGDDVYARVYGGDDFREGVAAFLAKRPARFHERTPA